MKSICCKLSPSVVINKYIYKIRVSMFLIEEVSRPSTLQNKYPPFPGIRQNKPPTVNKLTFKLQFGPSKNKF